MVKKNKKDLEIKIYKSPAQKKDENGEIEVNLFH